MYFDKALYQCLLYRAERRQAEQVGLGVAAQQQVYSHTYSSTAPRTKLHQLCLGVLSIMVYLVVEQQQGNRGNCVSGVSQGD